MRVLKRDLLDRRDSILGLKGKNKKKERETAR